MKLTTGLGKQIIQSLKNDFSWELKEELLGDNIFSFVNTVLRIRIVKEFQFDSQGGGYFWKIEINNENYNSYLNFWDKFFIKRICEKRIKEYLKKKKEEKLEINLC